MVRKITLVMLLVGVAAFSPAPINKSKLGSVKFAPQSEAQLAEQQKFNGLTPIVGQVPPVLNEVGGVKFEHKSAQVQHEGERSLQYGSMKADKVGNSAISQASMRLEQESSHHNYGYIVAMLVALAGFLSWKLFQFKVERQTPVPKFSKRMLREIENGRV